MTSAQQELERWLAKYEPVERAIIEARARRRVNKTRRKEARRRAWGNLCEATGGKMEWWRQKGFTLELMLELANGDAWTVQCLLAVFRRGATAVTDQLRHVAKRPMYYEAEAARRKLLAEERRKIRKRSTLNPCPTRDQILEAWIRRKDSHDATLHFGSLIQDLECYLDNSLRRDEAGTIIGRNGGVKAWLQANIPALHWRYTTVMRYKAMAKKVKQIAELADPLPAAAVLASEDKQDYGADEIQVLRARAIWLEVVAGVAANPTALLARVEALVAPDRVEAGTMLAAWRAKYENEITVRTKSKWRRRLFGGKSRGRPNSAG